MSIIDIVSLFIIMAALAFIPSTNVALIITRSITNGIANGIATALGIVLGDIAFILLVILGLSAIAETMGWLFLSMKYVGATYLIWFGYTLLRSKEKATLTINDTERKGNLLTSFLAGFFLTLGDIKAIFFYISLLPIFINLETITPIGTLILMLATLFSVGGVKIFYAVSARKIVSISTELKLENKAQKVAGSFMVGAGSYLIIKT